MDGINLAAENVLKYLSRSNLYEINWSKIEELLEMEFSSVKRDLIDLQHVNFVVNDVKVTFFVRENVDSSVMQSIPLMNHIDCATVESIGAMKLEMTQRRNLYRDYYDIYSILQKRSVTISFPVIRNY
jgi:predicted nucleotidyltransferase component of viral defense system